MSVSDLPFTDLSQCSPTVNLSKGSISNDVSTINEEDEDQPDSGGAPLSIYEDLSNYESLEDSDQDQGRSPLFNLSESIINLATGWYTDESDEEDGGATLNDLETISTTLARASPSNTPRPLPKIPRPLPKVPHLLPETTRPLPPLPTATMSSNVPRPGPAKLGPNAGLEEWLEEAKLCHYLPENAMKQLCEIVKACLMEGLFKYPQSLVVVLISLLQSLTSSRSVLRSLSVVIFMASSTISWSYFALRVVCLVRLMLRLRQQ